MLSSISLSKKAKKYGRWIVRLFSKTHPFSFFSKYKFYFTCIIARHICMKKWENHGKNSSLRLSDNRPLPNSHMTACTNRKIAIWLRKKSISAYCNTHKQHTMTEWNTLSDVKTPLKKTLYIRYSFSQRSRSFKKDEISTISDGLHEQIHFLTMI